MKTKLLTVRCPDDVEAAIAQAMNDRSLNKTDVVIQALRAGLGLSEPTEIPPSLADNLQNQINTIWGELDSLKKLSA